jgi:hypothetical protein
MVSSEADGITTGEPSTSLNLGDPLKAFFPPGVRICEQSGYAELHEPGKMAPLLYRQPSSSDAEIAGFEYPQIQDIIILGEVLIILLSRAVLISFIGSFCLGSIQPLWSGTTLRWFR